MNGYVLLQGKRLMNRFFVSEIDKDLVAITGNDYNHAKKVLRLGENDEIYAVYKEKEYVAKIKLDDGKNLIIENIKETKVLREPNVNIHIYQSLPKSSKMDYIVQKNVEIGINKLTPIISDRSLVKIKNNKKEKKKLQRWNKISEEAAKQSMRNKIPQIKSVLSFENMIQELKSNINDGDREVIVPYENELIKSAKHINYKKKNYSVVIGPEGGFERKEIDRLLEIGAKPITLGPRILRSETAALVLSTIIIYETGNMRRKL